MLSMVVVAPSSSAAELTVLKFKDQFAAAESSSRAGCLRYSEHVWVGLSEDGQPTIRYDSHELDCDYTLTKHITGTSSPTTYTYKAHPQEIHAAGMLVLVNELDPAASPPPVPVDVTFTAMGKSTKVVTFTRNVMPGNNLTITIQKSLTAQASHTGSFSSLLYGTITSSKGSTLQIVTGKP